MCGAVRCTVQSRAHLGTLRSPLPCPRILVRDVSDAGQRKSPAGGQRGFRISWQGMGDGGHKRLPSPPLNPRGIYSFRPVSDFLITSASSLDRLRNRAPLPCLVRPRGGWGWGLGFSLGRGRGLSPFEPQATLQCFSRPSGATIAPAVGCSVRSSGRPAAGSASRNIACGFASGSFRQRHRSRRWAAAHHLPDNRMSTFLAFISAATDFVLALNLKPAIVAAGFILMLMLTRRRGTASRRGKAPDRPKTPGPPTSV